MPKMTEPFNSSRSGDWVVQLENKPKKQYQLAHEIGAGAPCLVCGENCPGLDLHFWRKICRNCKCKKDEHNVDENDDVYDFEIIFGHKVKQHVTVLTLKLKNENNAQESTQKSVSLDWIPPNTSLELASEYMETLSSKNVPLSGSSGAIYRKQQIQRQIPLHDFNPALCHELSPAEIKEMESYAFNVRQNAAGQAQVVRTPVSKWLISSTSNTLQKPSSSSHLLDSHSRVHKGTDFVMINEVPGKFDNSDVNFKASLENSAELNCLHPMCAKTLMMKNKDPVQNIKFGLEDIKGNLNLEPYSSKQNNICEQRNLGTGLENDVSSSPQQLDITKEGNQNVFSHLETVNNGKGFETSKQISFPVPMYSSPLHRDFINQFSKTNLGGNIPNEITKQGLFVSNPDKNYQNFEINPETSNDILHENINAELYKTYNLNHNLNSKNLGSSSNESRGRTVSYMHPENLRGENKCMSKNISPLDPVYLTMQKKSSDLIYSEPMNNHAIELSKPLKRSNVQNLYDDKKCQYNVGDPHINPDDGGKFSNIHGSGNLHLNDQMNNPLIESDNKFNFHVSQREGRDSTLKQPYQLKVQNINKNGKDLCETHFPVNQSLNTYNKAKDFIVNDSQNQGYMGDVATNIPNTMDLSEEIINCPECCKKIEPGAVGIMVSKNSKILLWHPGCFVCCTCKEMLVDLLYFYHKGKIYCGRDYASSVKKIPRCFACDELIFVHQYTQAEGHSFHLKHFCCSECDILLAEKEYTPINNLPVCVNCYYAIYAKVCGTCKRKVSLLEKSITFNDLTWHSNEKCFACHYCHKSLLNAQMITKNKHPFCSTQCVLNYASAIS